MLAVASKDTIIISLGSKQGFKEGDKLDLFQTNDVKDDKGNVVFTDEKLVGELTIVSVQEDRSRASYAGTVEVQTGLDGEGQIASVGSKFERFLAFDSKLDAGGFCLPLLPCQIHQGAGHNNPARNNPPFEEALKKLEGVVEAMESDDLPLETLLARYEEGTKLVKICQEKLAEAELKIQQLEKNAAGEIKLKPLDDQE